MSRLIFLRDFIHHLKIISDNNDFSYYIYNDEKKAKFNLPFAVNIRAKIFGHYFQSWGVESDIDQATGKAIMELLERLSFFHSTPLYYEKLSNNLFYKKTYYQKILSNYQIPPHLLIPTNTNGIAIHKNKKLAIKSALNEVIERHVILRAFALNIPPKKITYQHIYHLPKHVKLFFYYWEGPLKKKVSVCRVNVRDKGNYYTSASSDKLKESLNKSFLEAVPLILHSTDEKELSKEQSQIIKNDLYSLSRFHRFSGNHQAQEFLEKDNLNNMIDLKISIKDFYYSELNYPKILGKVPFTCIRIISPKIQQLFFDNWNKNYLNPLLQWEQALPDFPHIIS